MTAVRDLLTRVNVFARTSPPLNRGLHLLRAVQNVRMLSSEAARQTMGNRFASTQDREVVVGLVVDSAESASLQLTPPELATSPALFRRPDGSSAFRPKHSYDLLF